MESPHETASPELESAEVALQTEKASHDRTLGDLHTVFRQLRDARSQIDTLVRERDDCREEIEDQRKKHEERLRRRAEELREHQAAFKKTFLAQRAEIEALRTEVDEGTSNLELVLEQQDELRAEGDAAIKMLQEIDDNSIEIQELRGKMALTTALREDEVKRERARAAAAEELRDMAIRKIKTLKDSAAETATQHEKAIAAAKEEVSRQAQREIARAQDEAKKAIEEAKWDIEKELEKTKPEVAALNKAVQERNQRIEQLSAENDREN
jgi:chromosome segregation ATPase